MKHMLRKFSQVIVAMGLSAAASLANGEQYRLDAPRELTRSSDTQLWGVGLQKTISGHRIHSITRLNGSRPVVEEPKTVIASGSAGTWQWEVRAVASLLPSWKAWENDGKVQLRAAGPDDWDHPAASWEQAFTRAYKVVNYLLGRDPLPLKLTVLLVPDGSAYQKNFVEDEAGPVPLTFAFYYPSSASATHELTARRFSALVEIVATSVYEYQHIYFFTETIKHVGNNLADKTINEEARSECWSDAAYLALTSGTHTEHKWDAAAGRDALLAGEGRHKTPGPGKQPDTIEVERRFSNAWPWGKYLAAKTVSSYLRAKGFPEARVMSNEPEAMNAVMSLCRAMTQHPLDLTAGDYPAPAVEYAPFFPTTLGRQKSNAGPDPN